ncbi:helix-turn-helix transcriptional regulator [Streptomyces liangshanensis]|uniref:Helix-turn-helix transcriptional regulator n=2 Tax=Streptomyces liangshanensis TaxID=2717324 RepID=A0A6G9H982_9ACTN|nr:helix-turn-helix transcriptional regulator [Streptomyces liangshanensis]
MDVLLAGCRSRDVFVDLADKWSLLILLSLLRQGPQRFSELQRSVGGISRKMLSQTLRTLERDGVLVRTVHQDRTPPLVIYGLSELGAEVAEEARSLCSWAQRRALRVHEARAAFDERMRASESATGRALPQGVAARSESPAG